jgi:hypothetical protein
MTTEQLEALRNHEAPLPGTRGQVIAQALRLRRQGLPYGAISRVIDAYHGVYISEGQWRRILRDRGAPPKHYANGNLRRQPGVKA